MENRAQAFLSVWETDRDYALLCLAWMTSAERAALLQALPEAERAGAWQLAIERRTIEGTTHHDASIIASE